MRLKRKGITPVIAIVLLLLITVGAVGVVYTQFQNIAGENGAQDQVNQQQRLQNADYTINGVSRNSADNYQVYIKNTGDETFNLNEDATLFIGVNGNDPVAVNVAGGTNCGWSTATVAPGGTANCDTGITWDSAYVNDGQSTRFQLKLQGVTKASYSCTERSASTGDTC